MSEIGIGMIIAADRVYYELIPLSELEFDAGEPVHRIDDCGNYVSEYDWQKVWSKHPSILEKIYVLSWEYGNAVTEKMSEEEINRLYDDPNFSPDVVYFTTWE